MPRVPRCPECRRPMEWRDETREHVCPECDAEALDEITGVPEGFTTHEYDEEDRP